MEKKKWLTTENVSTGMFGASLRPYEDIESVNVKRDTRDGKNLITVEVNGELVFSYDSNFKGECIIVNNIQKPYSYDASKLNTTPMDISKIINESDDNIKI